jgi:hypothetical protein
MAKGYRIIEPVLIDPLLKYDKYHSYAVPIFYWLIEELYKELKDQLEGVDIEVIKVEYMGAYPVLGLKYEIKPYEAPNFQLEKTVEETANRLLRERPISDLVNFIATSGMDWKEMTAWVMTKSTNFASLYREKVWDRFYPYHPFNDAVDQAEFRLVLERVYKDAKENLRSPNDSTTYNSKYLFLSAIGLLAYGVLSSVSDILDNMRLVPEDCHQMAGVINFILPLPEGMNVFNNPDATKIWVARNRNNLQFREGEGMFILTDHPQA